MLRSSHVAVALVGGPTSLCRWTGAELIHELDVLTSSRGDGEMALVVMLSRRTPPETVQMILEWSRGVQRQRERHLHVQVIEVGSWGQGPNPYLAVRPLPAQFCILLLYLFSLLPLCPAQNALHITVSTWVSRVQKKVWVSCMRVTLVASGAGRSRHGAPDR